MLLPVAADGSERHVTKYDRPSQLFVSKSLLHLKTIWEKVAVLVALSRRNLSCPLHCPVHGSLARAGKVKSQTPKVEKQEKKKTPKGRAKKRILYNRR